jgi:hypothetical protein
MKRTKHVHRHTVPKIHPAASAGLPGGASAGPGGELPGPIASVESGALPATADVDADAGPTLNPGDTI